jgi:acetoin utilization deacetylase AcuC-like enzyme
VVKKRSIIIYSPFYNLDLGTHVFPAQKYSFIYDRIKKDKDLKDVEIIAPEKANMEDLELVHTNSYLDDLFSFEHTFRTMYSELPLTRNIIHSFMYGVGGTVLAMQKSNEYSFCYNIGGGYHHSLPDRAEGFCYLNDVAIATKLYLFHNPDKKVLIIDLDLHQGNGNSYIFKNHPNVFTFSIHQGNIYPKKEESNLDIAVEPGIKDKEYLRLLDDSLASIKKDFKPDLIFYLAGADPYEHDTLGEMKISMNGMKERDLRIVNFSLERNVSTVIVTAGGYAKDPNDTVRLHYNSVKIFCGS